MPSYCLNIHAGYACAHTGACCTAGWPIPVEAPLLTAVERKLLTAAAPPFRTATASDGTLLSILAVTDDGSCVFFEADRGRLCAVHRTMGPELLPAACRNFPRVAMRDPRGLFVTLSHYCPTAARLLIQDRDLAIIEAPLSLTLDGAVEGLDATGVLPPLLRPGMLMSLDACTRWEHEAVATLNDRALTARAAVRTIADATADAACWRPGGETLSRRIDDAFALARRRAERAPATTGRLEHAARSFLAAHAFANWSAYQAGGIGASAAALSSALAALEGHLAAQRAAHASEEDAFIAAVRAADFQLRHTRTDVSSGSLSPLRRD